MLDLLQNLFNRISDQLGPLGPYHPPKNERLGLAHYRFFFTVMVPLFVVLVTVVLAVIPTAMLFSSPRAPHTLRAVYQFTIYSFRTFWWIIPASAMVYAISTFPFAFFWNRRAATLPPDAEPEPLVESETWPPPPNRPRADR